MEKPMLTIDTDTQETGELSPNWGASAPRGGMAVMNRILKDKATVPLFFAQTLIQSLRDVGYPPRSPPPSAESDTERAYGAPTRRPSGLSSISRRPSRRASSSNKSSVVCGPPIGS
jgi:hypothetical protein